MSWMVKLLLIGAFGVGSLWAAPARAGVLTFTQADGSTFQGLLKGNAAFHWIESEGEVVLYNPKDGNYYRAEVINNTLQMSREKVAGAKHAKARTLHGREGSHRVSQKEREALERLYRDAQRGHRPR